MSASFAVEMSLGCTWYFAPAGGRSLIFRPVPRVDWGMAEVLAFGTLALHREVQPESLVLAQTDDPTTEAIRGLNKGACSS